MAVLEQLVFGFPADGQKRRQILGHSPGLRGEFSQEIVKLCEGWGPVPEGGLRRPVLMSFPLAVRLKSLPGDLYAVIRIAPGARPIFHALVLNRSDYLEFDWNPFALAQEDVFFSSWQDSIELPRRQMSPSCLAPLVSPPPDPSDVGSVDEAVRQMLANQRLLLPLEQSGRDSDRFLALAIASLPRAVRQELRFASWAPSGSNLYSLAATQRDLALFSSWRPYLMTSVLGDLHPTCEEYLEGLKHLLATGDLAGLERHSASSRVELGRTAVKKRKTPAVLSATVESEVTGKVTRTAPPSAGQRRVSTPPAGRPNHVSRIADRPEPPRRRSLRYRGPDTGRFRRTMAVVLSLGILTAGGFYLWTPGAQSLFRGGTALDHPLPIISEGGDVDVAMFYDRLMGPFSGSNRQSLDRNRRMHGLERLSQAGEMLLFQGRGYVDEADRALVEDVPVEELLPRGPALARQLQLLALAQVSLHEQVDWSDLASLTEERLQARFDSLLVCRRMGGSLEPSMAQTQRLLQNIEQRTRQLEAVRALEQLMGQEKWFSGWDQRVETAVESLYGLRPGQARQLRDDALLMIRFKRAEHATNIAARAYADDFGPGSFQTPAVLDILPDLKARTPPGHSSADPPALLRATAEFYRTMAWASEPEAPIERLGEACRQLASNRAVSFDPAVYGELVARLRFNWMSRLVAAGEPVSTLPGECLPSGAPHEHLAFLEGLAADPDVAGWRELAAEMTDSFLVRWALYKAESQTSFPAE